MQTYLQRRQSGYYYRQRVPKRLQEAIGRSEIVVSLQTRCRETAAYRSAHLRAAVTHFLNTKGPMHHDDLTHELAAQIASRWKRSALNRDLDERIAGKPRVDSPEEIHARLDHARDDLNQVNLDPYQAIVDRVIDEQRLEVGPDAQRRLGYYLLKAQTEFLEEVHKRSDPTQPHPMAYIPPPPPPESAPPPELASASEEGEQGPGASKRLRLSEALDRWSNEEGRRTLTVQDWRYRVQRFIEFKGDPYVHEITADDVYDFVDAYEQMPSRMPKSIRRLPMPEIIERYRGLDVARLAPQSVTNAVTSVGSILSWCVKKRIVKDNVAHGIRASKNGQGHQRRLPYRPEDLKRIFEDSPVFARGHRPHGGAGHAAYWIPVLALYTGARLEEIGQLMLQDIRTEGGVVSLEIGDTAEGQSVKNAASRRRVPLHQRVIQLGFMDYVAETRRRGHQDLFPHVQSTKAKRTAAYSKWVNRYFRQACGITDRRKVFHSFRHTFSDACREAEIPREVRNALMGHTTSGVDQDYGAGYSLRVLDHAVQKIQYQGLRIPPWQPAHA